jgi:DNA-directed RNA polymerase subunit M/transcription elongation factor TFIIS
MTLFVQAFAALTEYREHLYRRHKVPIRCARCGVDFPNDKALIDHSRQPESCALRRVEHVNGIDKVQEAQLKRRKKPTETEEQRWKAMFLILFPDDDEDAIPSPCKSTQLALSKD